MKSGLLLVLALAACSADLPPIVGCEAVGDIKPVCGMQTPEDIAALPDGRHLLLSNFGGMVEGTGSLSLFDTQTDAIKSLFPLTGATQGEPRSEWGESNCAPPPADLFRPHGTHLHQLIDGRWRYLVVNHGGRESIEMFELLLAGGDSSLTWRACVMAAPETIMNDVVGLANGDLIFSRMFHKNIDRERLQSIIGMDTGDLWRWNQDTGLRILPGTGASEPNGLEISADDRYVFANMYFNKEIWKIDAYTGETVGVGKVAHADNSAWGSDGRLWLATHNGGFAEMMTCLAGQDRPCGASFEIIAMDPETMATEVVFSHRGPPMGAATIAVPQAGRVYMGSFVGDRLISVPDFGVTD